MCVIFSPSILFGLLTIFLVQFSVNGLISNGELTEDAVFWSRALLSMSMANTQSYTSSSPAPTPYDYFPNGGQCGNTCEKDNDCFDTGYSPCLKCGEKKGTLVYKRCYRDPNR
mmetsp:Transcript_13002/g.18638  ORF Transcript_13002/g.18638 Transcript_13002/m.18638 type:complete len:113 (-) Transcript_13002:342-680(-)